MDTGNEKGKPFQREESPDRTKEKTNNTEDKTGTMDVDDKLIGDDHDMEEVTAVPGKEEGPGSQEINY